MNFVFVHLGYTEIPQHTFTAINQCKKYNPNGKYYLVTSQKTRNLIGVTNFVFETPKEADNTFRNGFWTYTKLRFIAILELVKFYNLKYIIHIENDVMVYHTFGFSSFANGSIRLIKDNINRVIPSIVMLKNASAVYKLTRWIENNWSSGNDMDILAKLSSVDYLPFHPETKDSSNIYDGAAIGQYLDGIDPRNGNSSPGFINETCDFKCSDYTISKQGDFWEINNKTINNLHIHSKRLERFVTIDSGDKVFNDMDYIITTPGINEFHKSLDCKGILICISNWEKFNGELIEQCKCKVKIGVYAHIFEHFAKYILPKLNKRLDYEFYFHNSDHSFNDSHFNVLKDVLPKFTVYSQNNTCKFANTLPIGIANAMWPHGETETVNKVIRNLPTNKRNDIYININESTHPFRKQVMSQLSRKSVEPKKYKEYLKELGEYKYALCLRGNGYDTHRFWESVYLGVIPVLILDGTDDYAAFVDNLSKIAIFKLYCNIAEFKTEFNV